MFSLDDDFRLTARLVFGEFVPLLEDLPLQGTRREVNSNFLVDVELMISSNPWGFCQVPKGFRLHLTNSDLKQENIGWASDMLFQI